MKMKGTATTGRISALQRLGSSSSGKTSVHQRLSLPTGSAAPAVTDARDLLTKRQKPIADARQLLSRPSTSAPTKITIKNEAVAPKLPKKVVTPSETAAKQKIVISLVNDQYKKKALSPPPAVIKRPQVTTTTTERRKRARDDDDDDEPEERAIERPEPLAKRLSVRKPIKEPEEVKTPAPPISSSTILITNLQASVTEDDVLVTERTSRLPDRLDFAFRNCLVKSVESTKFKR